jgi:ribosome maturation factor RimP
MSTMITESVVRELIDAKNEGTDRFIVSIHIGSSNKISVEIDSDSGVTVSDCIEVSKGVDQNLDREIEDYSLDVASPGLTKPLKVFRQYVKNVGRNVKVTTTDDVTLEGELLAADETEIVVKTTVREKVEGKKGKQTVITDHVIPFEKIKETYIVISFK